MASSLIAGGYAQGEAAGLYPLAFDRYRLTAGAPVATVSNVSAGVRIDGSRWFLVDEQAGDIVLADAAQGWRSLLRAGSGGGGPCHLALDRTATLLAVANYDSGTTALFRLGAGGLPMAAPATFQHDGSGPNLERQGGPHAHWVGFSADGSLYATDLGADRILVFGAGDMALAMPRIAFAAPPGSGPRQIAFHPELRIAYLVSELASTLTVLRIGDDGLLAAWQTHATLPAGIAVDNLVGAIVLDGDRLHISNRGHDSIATFVIGAEGGVRLLGHQTTGGSSPRFLLVHRDHLFVAHEHSGGVTALPLDAERRPGPPALRADVPKAAFIGVLS